MTDAPDEPRWRDLGDGREARVVAGISVIRPKVLPLGLAPAECPVCREVMRTDTDPRAYEELGCCSLCESRWADGLVNRGRWLSGWRPSADEVAAAVALRSPLLYG